MQGFATKTMLRHLTGSREADLLAPEVEAPRRGCPPPVVPPLKRRCAQAYRIVMWAIMLAAAAVIGFNSRIPAEPFMASSAGNLTVACEIDYAENCMVCRYTDARGRQLHKHHHCPALQQNGLFTLPLAARKGAVE